MQKIDILMEQQGKSLTYFANDNIKIDVGEYVVVRTMRGLELVKVMKVTPNAQNVNKDFFIIRKGNNADKKKYQENMVKAQQLLLKTKLIVQDLNLDMKVILGELTLDETKIIISFSAENRVDFRELVKILANKFKLKIELRQIGPRDVVKLVKGIGPCGRECCCVGALSELKTNSMKMAKMQGVALNPNNINGLCNKLKCCLAYENDLYVDNYLQMPRVGSMVTTPDGKGKVLYNNILNKTVQVKVEEGYKEFKLEELKDVIKNS